MSDALVPIEIFCSYAHEDTSYLQKLETHLSVLKRQELISTWHDRQIVPGTDWDQAIDTHLNSASVILLLISSDFLASDYCSSTEMERALQRHQANEARVIPILLRPVDWQEAPFAHLQALPTDAKPITMWRNQDEAFADVAAGIRRAIKDLASLNIPTPHMPVRGPRSTSRIPTQQQRTLIVQRLRQEYSKRLAQSLQGVAMMILGLHERTDVISSSAQLVFHRTDIAQESPLQPGTSILQAYDDAGQGLLILGAPGAGKTTLLLDLAEALLARGQSDPTHPIAVILNLSSWASKKPPLEAFLIDQLTLVYGIPSRLGQTLLEQEHWLLLLDGLDEVEASARSACIEAINHYREEHFVPLVVCSRSHEYVKEQMRLALPSAVEVQPLQEPEVKEYLKRLGKSMATVRVALRTNPVLSQLLTTPLMLSVVILAYRDKSTKDLPQLGSVEEQQQQIFARYVERMLERRTTRSGFTPQQTRQWLIWLAQQMQQRHLTELYLERLQPSWLSLGWTRIAYPWLSGCLNGFVFGMLFGLILGFLAVLLAGILGGLIIALLNGLICGLACGVIGMLISGVSSMWSKSERQLIETLSWSWSNFLEHMKSVWILSLVFSGLGLFLGVRSLISTWGLLNSALIGLASGIVLSLYMALFSILVQGVTFGISKVQINEQRFSQPNQGIYRSGWNALLMGMIFWILYALAAFLLFGLVVGFEVWAQQKWNDILNSMVAILILGGLFVGGLAGPGYGLHFGGAAFLNHYLLRFLLWRNRAMPRHYVRFLEEATERILLQRTGGGYRFIHPLFQQYFASQETETSPRSLVQSSQQP